MTSSLAVIMHNPNRTLAPFSGNQLEGPMNWQITEAILSDEIFLAWKPGIVSTPLLHRPESTGCWSSFSSSDIWKPNKHPSHELVELSERLGWLGTLKSFRHSDFFKANLSLFSALFVHSELYCCLSNSGSWGTMKHLKQIQETSRVPKEVANLMECLPRR